MVVGLIVLFIFLLIIGGASFAVYRMLKITDPKNAGQSVAGKTLYTQEFLPFQNIENSIIELGGHRYRAIIDVSSINYSLRTGNEKEAIELSYQRFLNSLSFPIMIFIQTKTIDNTKLLRNMENDLQNIILDFPQLTEYANSYFYEETILGERIGNNKQKKKYIVIPFDDAINLNDLTEEEKKEYAFKELSNRVSIVKDGLLGVGLKATTLNTMMIYELIHSITHRDNYQDFDEIFNGEYSELIVTSNESIAKDLTPQEILDWILYEAEKRIQQEVPMDNEASIDIFGRIEAIRNEYANTTLMPFLVKEKKAKEISFEQYKELFGDSLLPNEKEMPSEESVHINSKSDENEVQVDLTKNEIDDIL